MTEHRAHARAEIALEVSYRRMNAFFADYTKDISKGGIFLRSQAPLPVGTELELEFKLPSRTAPLTARGVVRWVNDGGRGDPGMGLEFVWTSDEARQRFQSDVEALMIERLGEELYRKLNER